jgi:hypothetical protein
VSCEEKVEPWVSKVRRRRWNYNMSLPSPEVSKKKGILIGIITFAAAIGYFYLAYFLYGPK